MEKSNHPTMANGKICYIEIPAIDVLLSASFYKKYSAGKSVSEAMVISLLMIL